MSSVKPVIAKKKRLKVKVLARPFVRASTVPATVQIVQINAPPTPARTIVRARPPDHHITANDCNQQLVSADSAPHPIPTHAGGNVRSCQEPIVPAGISPRVTALLERFVQEEVLSASLDDLRSLKEEIWQAKRHIAKGMKAYVREEAAWKAGEQAIEEANMTCVACFEGFGLDGQPANAATLAAAAAALVPAANVCPPTWEEVDPHMSAIHILSSFTSSSSSIDPTADAAAAATYTSGLCSEGSDSMTDKVKSSDTDLSDESFESDESDW